MPPRRRPAQVASAQDSPYLIKNITKEQSIALIQDQPEFGLVRYSESAKGYLVLQIRDDKCLIDCHSVPPFIHVLGIKTLFSDLDPTFASLEALIEDLKNNADSSHIIFLSEPFNYYAFALQHLMTLIIEDNVAAATSAFTYDGFAKSKIKHIKAINSNPMVSMWFFQVLEQVLVAHRQATSSLPNKPLFESIELNQDLSESEYIHSATEPKVVNTHLLYIGFCVMLDSIPQVTIQQKASSRLLPFLLEKLPANTVVKQLSLYLHNEQEIAAFLAACGKNKCLETVTLSFPAMSAAVLESLGQFILQNTPVRELHLQSMDEDTTFSDQLLPFLRAEQFKTNQSLEKIVVNKKTFSGANQDKSEAIVFLVRNYEFRRNPFPSLKNYGRIYDFLPASAGKRTSETHLEKESTFKKPRTPNSSSS